jgi:hypothetical protein
MVLGEPPRFVITEFVPLKLTELYDEEPSK